LNNYELTYFHEALTQIFKAKTVPHGIVRLSHGPQFSNAGSTFGFIFLLFLILIMVVSMVQGSYLMGLVLLPVCVCVVGYVLGYEGVEVDTRKMVIRQYRSFLGLRSGEWRSLTGFNSLRVCQDAILEKRSLDSGTSYATSRDFDRHVFYSLCIVNREEKLFIKLYEDENMLRISSIAENFSELSQLPLESSIVSRQPDVVGRWRIF
jgi:hypothetical protein